MKLTKASKQFLKKLPKGIASLLTEFAIEYNLWYGEVEVLTAKAAGYDTASIAVSLGKAKRTVQRWYRAVINKLREWLHDQPQYLYNINLLA